MSILFVIPAYEGYPIVLHSLHLQQDPNWHALVVHDGPASQVFRERVSQISANNPGRISLIERPSRGGSTGHYARDYGIEHVKKNGGFNQSYVVHTNIDNYYAPNFTVEITKAFRQHSGMQAVYCDCIHSAFGWSVLKASLQLGGVDCGCVAVRKNIAVEVGWKHYQYEGDWYYINDVIQKCGKEKFYKIDRPLFVHN